MGSTIRDEDGKTFSKDMFEFRQTRIVCGNKGAAVGIMIGLRGPDGMRKESMGNLFGNEEGLGES